MKKILGLDLGVASIGWAFINEAENENEKSEIVDLGVRIIPIDIDSKSKFEKGQAITINQDRTLKRGARRNLDRYQLRRKSLSAVLKALNMLPDENLIKLKTIDLYSLRDKALSQKIELKEIGRVLLHLNQKRGYKSSRKEDAKNETENKGKESAYLGGISTRSTFLKENNLTIGQKIYIDFLDNYKQNDNKIVSLSIKNEVYPREDYINEFNLIWAKQMQFYPEILTESNRQKIRDEIIYHQRPLKSQKGLVSICEFEGKKVIVIKDNKQVEKFIGPKVAARSNPISQVCKIWESVNTIQLESKDGFKKVIPNIEQKNILFEYLNNNEKLGINELRSLLKLDKTYRTNQQVEKVGLKGNDTRIRIINALIQANLEEKIINSLTKFDPKFEAVDFNEILKKSINAYQPKLKSKKFSADKVVVDMHTGEEIELLQISAEIEKEPLYIIWHLLHSIDDKKELLNALLNNNTLKKLGLTEIAAYELTKVVFKSDDYGNKSCKAIRKIIPYLMNGYVYSDACALAGHNHSDTLTKEDNLKRDLLNQLPLLKKGELRQPVVEKILNQLINLVNAILKDPTMGKPDEIRIELARELQQSADERNDAYSYNNKRSAENDESASEIEKYGLKPTAHRIKKWRVWHETKGYSLYTGKTIGLSEFLNAQAVDIEHIIPQSQLFDNSLSNWTICEREENIKKGAQTAYDWMKNKGEAALEEYVKQVNYFYQQFIEKNPKEKGIYRVGFSKRKRDYLLMPFEKIPADFISRQLNETRYITRKSSEILKQVCHNVKITSGSVTDYLRHHWGYDNILHDLNFERYKNAGLTYINEDKKERIKDWSKRMDHRHHAIDALVVACTKQSIIQRLNNLNQKKEKFQNLKEVDNKGLKKLVEDFKLIDTKTLSNKIENTLVSFKAGKRVVSRRKNKVGNQLRLEPRGPLHEESVYGLIKRVVDKPVKLNAKFKIEDVENIVSGKHKKLVKERLAAFDNNPAIAFNKLNKNPIWISEEHKNALTEVKVYEYTTAIKYKLNESFKEKDAEYIIDKAIKNLVKERFKEKGANALKDLENNPILFNGKPVKSVRCYAEVTAYEVLKFDKEKNKPKSVVKPGNNHHVTICADENGKQYEFKVVTFWEAVANSKLGLPVFSKPNGPNHKMICTLQENEIVKVPDKALINSYYRVQKITSGNYWFMNIFNTVRDESLTGKKVGTAIQFSAGSFNAKKIKVNILGKIV
jgi:CRISPR-associated endonuclease Csn1